MRKKALFLSLSLVFSLFLAGCGGGKVVDTKPILFFKTSCPHCQNVEEFITQNQIREQYSFSEVEVNGDRSNAQLFSDKSKECKLDQNNLGVPMFYADGQCYLGDEDIINYFKQKLSI
ncbi:MAG TPA: hypothetical protein PKI61_00110 [bacterium]|nr:hypothetical protein [bacterium]HPT29453.1 hypothetical protein [bacterium]